MHRLLAVAAKEPRQSSAEGVVPSSKVRDGLSLVGICTLVLVLNSLGNACVRRQTRLWIKREAEILFLISSYDSIVGRPPHHTSYIRTFYITMQIKYKLSNIIIDI